MYIDKIIKFSHEDTSLKQRDVSIKDRYLYLLLVAFCCLACSRSESFAPTPPPRDASIAISILLPGLDSPKTYADNPDIAKDMEIENVSILVFEANNDSTGQFLYSSTNLRLTADNKFTVNLELTNSAIRIHVFANAPMGSLKDEGYKGQKEKDVLKSIEVGIDQNDSYTLPMYGCLLLPNVVVGKINKSLQLLRSVARVDVQVDNTTSLNPFKLHGIAVYFTPDKACFVSRSILIKDPNLRVITPTMPTEYKILDKGETVPRAKVVKEEDLSITNHLFLYENQDYTKMAGSVKRNSRIVVSGYYNGSKKLSYYPVDFQTTNEDGSKESIPILRNHQYMLTITAVKDVGYPSEETAANSDPVDITTSITWDQPTEYIIFEGKNYLHIEKRSLILYGDDGVRDSLLVGSNINPSEWEMRWGSDGDYQKGDTPLKGSHFIVEKPIVNEEGYLTFTTKNAFTSDISEVLYIRVASRLELTVAVSQDKGILTVDGQTGTINVEAMHYGGLYTFHVLTGDASIGWKAAPNSNLVKMIDSYDEKGDNNAYLRVNIKPNLNASSRTGTMTVSRSSGVGVADVKLKIIQEEAPYITVEIPRILAAPTKKTSVPAAFYDYDVIVSDPLRYTWKATTTFNPSDVSIGNTAGVAKEVVLGASGEQVRIYVKGRTSEQFDGIGQIKLELVRKTTNLPISVGKQIKNLTVAAYITVNTGNGNGIYLYDRNVGDGVPDADTPAEYYTNIDRYTNPEFRGDRYVWNDNAKTICEDKIGSGWRLPTKDEYWNIINYPLQYDELLHGAAYIQDGNIKCYFPLSGNDEENNEYYEHADYWSSTSATERNAYAFCLPPYSGTTVYDDKKSRGFYIRCVKDIPN